MAAHKHHPSHAHQVTECKHPLLWHRPKEAYSSVLWAWLTYGDPTLIGRDCHVILSKQRTLHVYNLPGLLFKTSLTCSVYNMYCNNCVSLICVLGESNVVCLIEVVPLFLQSPVVSDIHRDTGARYFRYSHQLYPPTVLHRQLV